MSSNDLASSIGERSALGDLVVLLVLFVLVMTGKFEDVFGSALTPPSPLRLGAPRVVAMSATQAGEAAQLLGSSVAQLVRDEQDPRS